MADPAPAIDRRTSPRRSNSVTLAAQPRTFEDILPWPGFRNGAQQYFSSLDNTSRIYRQATYDILDGEDDEPAADEAEVRGFVMRLLRSVNTAAKQLGIQVRYSAGEAAGACRAQTWWCVLLAIHMTQRTSAAETWASLR